MDMDNRGWLYKRGKFVQSWKNRYFIVDPIKHTLCYYQSPPEEAEAKGRIIKPHGIIDLTNSSVIAEKGTNFPENCFRLSTPGRDYYISASDPFKMNTWISVLRLNSKLGTLEKSVEKEIPDGKIDAEAAEELDEQYSLSFKLAANKMLKTLSDTAVSSRSTLEEVSTKKYEVKNQLKKYKEAVKAQHTELEAKLKQLRTSESDAHGSLDSINTLIVKLDKYLQASRYIQKQTITIFSLNQNMPTTVRTLRDMIRSKRATEIPKEIIQGYLDLLTECFPPDKVRLMTNQGIMENTNDGMDFLVMRFYSKYFDCIHLPKQIKLEPAKFRRLDTWRKLVSSVNGIKRVCEQLSELSIIEREINKVINPALATRSRPISMIDPDEDDDFSPRPAETSSFKKLGKIPEESTETKKSKAPLGLKLYKSEWESISNVVVALTKLREREKELSQKLDDALHSRELLASFSSKRTPKPSPISTRANSYVSGLSPTVPMASPPGGSSRSESKE